MLQLNFRSIKESKPSDKWQSIFNMHWNAYRTWFESKGAFKSSNLEDSQKALKKYMPKFVETYDKLVDLSDGSTEAKRFLTGYNPPAYISGCSQLAFSKKPQLIRNYDYHPLLCEGTLLMTKWHDKKVIAVGDCLWGAVDGMNEKGIAISLTFGGRKTIGKGFGIPFIIRYALEFSSSVEEAVETLCNIPSHMAYNVAIMDKNGKHKIIQLAPDRKPLVTDSSVSTNHQGAIDWPEHANFSKTLEREEFLKQLLLKEDLTQEQIANVFLKAPLFSKRYTEGFGTVYTSIYKPKEGKVEIRWQNDSVMQSFDNFKEQETLIPFGEATYTAPVYERPADVEGEFKQEEYSKYTSEVFSIESIEILLQNLQYIPGFDSKALKARLENMSDTEKKRGELPWEMVADFWVEFGKSFSA